MKPAVCALVFSLMFPMTATAEANNPWPAVERFLALNGCRISEEQLVEVLASEGVDTWTINVMVTNFANTAEVTYENQTGLYRVRNSEICS